MARREDIETSIWSEPDFQELPGAARAVYIWSFSNQHCGMAGIYKVSRQSIALETGFDGRQLEEALERLQAERFLFYDGRVLFVRTRVKHLRTKSPSIARSIARDLELVGAHPFVEMWWAENERFVFLSSVEKPVVIGDSEGPSGPPRGPLGGSQGTGTGKGIKEVGGVGGETRPAPRRVDQTVPPDGMPDELHPRIEDVLPILHGAYELRGGVEPQPRGVGLGIMRNPSADHVTVARKLAHWLTSGRGQNAPCKDIAARFGDWVADEIAGRPLSLAGRQPALAGSGRFSAYDKAAGL